MKTILALAASLFLAIGAAQAQTATGPVAITAIQPMQPGSGCAFFQIKGGAPGAWFAILGTDASFNSQLALIMSAYYSNQSVTFSTAGTACTYPKISWIVVGTPN